MIFSSKKFSPPFAAIAFSALNFCQLAFAEDETIGSTQSDVALNGTLRELSEFSEKNTPLDKVRIFDEFALIYAARNFEPDRLKVIVDSHTSLDITDDTGTTAVMHALMAGRIENAKFLYERGASLEGVNDQGYTVRVLAEEAGLLGFGPEYRVSLPNPDVAPEDANLILLLAAEAGDTPLIDWAMSLGADLSTKADNGLQAAHLAALGGHEWTFDFILSHESAPDDWATLRSTKPQEQALTVVDFLLAGEGGGNHTRAGRMLTRVLREPSLSSHVFNNKNRFRKAMIAIGYPMDLIVAHFGEPELPVWDIGIPTSGSTRGGSLEEWQNLQRFLADEGLYVSDIDGVPGRGTLRAIVLHTTRKIPDLVERIETVQDLVKLREPGATEWFTAEGIWHLALAKSEAGLPLGYALSLPEGMKPPTELEMVPHGQTYRYRPIHERNHVSDLIQFTYAAPDEDHLASFSMPIFGAIFEAVFYEDRFTYQLQGVTRRYTATGDVPLIVGLGAD